MYRLCYALHRTCTCLCFNSINVCMFMMQRNFDCVAAYFMSVAWNWIFFFFQHVVFPQLHGSLLMLLFTCLIIIFRDGSWEECRQCVCKSVCVFCVLMQPPSDSDQASSQCVPPPISKSPPAPPSPEPPTPALVPPPSSPRFEEPGVGLVGGEQEPAGVACQVTAPSAAEEGAAVTAAATHIPLAEVKLESMLDPTELSTVSAERHRPGTQLSPKQRQSQKPPATAA